MLPHLQYIDSSCIPEYKWCWNGPLFDKSVSNTGNRKIPNMNARTKRRDTVEDSESKVAAAEGSRWVVEVERIPSQTHGGLIYNHGAKVKRIKRL